jgi:hypothetical protein
MPGFRANSNTTMDGSQEDMAVFPPHPETSTAEKQRCLLTLLHDLLTLGMKLYHFQVQMLQL